MTVFIVVKSLDSDIALTLGCQFLRSGCGKEGAARDHDGGVRGDARGGYAIVRGRGRETS